MLLYCQNLEEMFPGSFMRFKCKFSVILIFCLLSFMTVRKQTTCVGSFCPEMITWQYISLQLTATITKIMGGKTSCLFFIDTYVRVSLT